MPKNTVTRRDEAGTLLINFCATSQILAAIEIDWHGRHIGLYLDHSNLNECILFALLHEITFKLRARKINVRPVGIGNTDDHIENFHKTSQPIRELTHSHLTFDKPIDANLIREVFQIIYAYQSNTAARFKLQKEYFDSESFITRYFHNFLKSPKYSYLNQKKFLTSKSLQNLTKILKDHHSTLSSDTWNTATIQNIFLNTTVINRYIPGLENGAQPSTELICPPVLQLAAASTSSYVNIIPYFAPGWLAAAGMYLLWLKTNKLQPAKETQRNETKRIV
jgi:hypothetical protein